MYDFTDEDDLIEDLQLKRKRLIGKYDVYPNKFFGRKPLFAYDFIDTHGATDYSFVQQCLDNSDATFYFTKLKELSGYTIDELIESDHSHHFHIYSSPTKKQLDLIRTITGKQTISTEETPALGQIALYTNPDALADRDTGIKSPRIYFMVGEWAVLYILFYDPFHEINGTPKKKS